MDEKYFHLNVSGEVSNILFILINVLLQGHKFNLKIISTVCSVRFHPKTGDRKKIYVAKVRGIRDSLP